MDDNKESHTAFVVWAPLMCSVISTMVVIAQAPITVQTGIICLLVVGASLGSCLAALRDRQTAAASLYGVAWSAGVWLFLSSSLSHASVLLLVVTSGVLLWLMLMAFITHVAAAVADRLRR